MELGDKNALNVIYSPVPGGEFVQIGMALQDHEIWLRQFSRDLLKVALLALTLSVGAGCLIARRTLRPIRRMAQTASSIAGPSMGRRMLISGRGDEVDQLAESFNGMLERIDTLVEGIRDVTENLAHDLRTPIAGIRGMAEVILSSKRDPEDYREALYRIIEQLDRVLNLSDAIFDVVEADNGALVMHFENVPLDDLANEIVPNFWTGCFRQGDKVRIVHRCRHNHKGRPGKAQPGLGQFDRQCGSSTPRAVGASNFVSNRTPKG